MLEARFIALILFVATIIALLFGLQSVGFMGVMLPVLIMSPLLMISRPKWALMFYWYWILVAPTLEFILRNRVINLAEQALASYLLVFYIGDIILRQTRTTGVTGFTRIVQVLLVWTLLSGFVNHVPAVVQLHFASGYLKHIVLFYFTVRFLEPGDARFLLRVMFWSFVVQVIFNIAYAVGINPLPQMVGRKPFDAFVGTLLNCHDVGYYSIVAVLMPLSLRRYLKSPSRKMWCLVAAFVALVHFVFTYTIHGYFLIALGIATQFMLFGGGRRTLHARWIGLVLLIICTAIVVLTESASTQWTKEMVTKTELDTRVVNALRGLKGQAYRDVFVRSNEILPHPLFGGGAGNYASNSAIVFNRPLARATMAYTYSGADYLARLETGSVLGAPRAGLISIWGDLGGVGSFLFWCLHVYAALRIWRQHRMGMYNDIYRQSMAEVLVPVIFNFLALNVIVDVIPTPHLHNALWIWIGFMWNPRKPEAGEVVAT